MGLPKQQTQGMLRWGRRTKGCMAVGSVCLLTLILFDNDHFPRFLAILVFVVGVASALGCSLCDLMYRREHERAPLL